MINKDLQIKMCTDYLNEHLNFWQPEKQIKKRGRKRKETQVIPDVKVPIVRPPAVYSNKSFVNE